MTDDDDALLAALAEHARAAPPDPRLEALLDGHLDAADHAALLAEAEHDPALAAGLAIFTPLDAGALDRLTDHLLAEVIGAEEADDAAPDPAEDADRANAPEATRAAPTGGRVLAFPTRRALWIAGPLLAAAAAIAFLVLRPTDSILPAYTAEVVGGDLEHRGEEQAPQQRRVLREGSRLRITLLPPTAHAHAIEVHAFVHDGATFEPWRPPVQQANQAALIEGTVEALGLTQFGVGPRTLVFQVVPAGAGAKTPSLDAGRTDVRQLLVPVVLE